eukprot:scaffold293_cov267-Prasinococcus_capsulatus_cf.AAC.2
MRSIGASCLALAATCLAAWWLSSQPQLWERYTPEGQKLRDLKVGILLFNGGSVGSTPTQNHIQKHPGVLRIGNEPMACKEGDPSIGMCDGEGGNSRI